MAFVQVQVTAKALKDLVDAGKNLDEICDAFKDGEGKALPKNTAKGYLKACGLKLKKVRKQRDSKFTLVNDLNTTEVPAIEASEPANV